MINIEEESIKAFLSHRKMPESVLDLIFNTPLASESIIWALFDAWMAGENTGTNKLNQYCERDINGSREDFSKFINRK